MGVPGNANALLLRSAAAAGGYQVSRSLRFNSSDSAYLSRTPASAGTSRTTWTLSFWLKRSTFSTAQWLFFSSDLTANTTAAYFTASDTLEFYEFQSGSYVARLITTQVFRDPSAWYHFVFTWDTNNGTSGDRLRIYVNNQRIDTFSTSTYPSSGTQSRWNNNVLHYLGRGVGSEYFAGYLADIHFIDGQALTPSSFTEVSATTGQLIPKAYTGSYGTNGFKLTFSDNSGTTSTTLGKDSAGSNNWTPNNFSVAAGAGNDSLVDTPTSYGTDTYVGGEVRGNYCTWNPLDKNANISSANGNLDASAAANVNGAIRGTIGVSSGKWYWEYLINNTSPAVGIATAAATLADFPGIDANGYSYTAGAQKWNNNSGSSYGATYTTNDIIGVALDLDAGTLVFYKNGVSQGTAYSGLPARTYFPAGGRFGGTFNVTLNAGQRAFAYTAPSGFKALCDTNLPAPLIAKPNTVMDVLLWTGNGSNPRSLTGLNFNPDLVWSKDRNGTAFHRVADSVRGTGNKQLYTNSTDAENAYPDRGYINSFDSSGFTVNPSGSTAGGFDAYNTNATTYVAWAWDAGTSTVTNTQGSITSSVRVNATAGFSIVTYTGNNNNGSDTVGHGLGVTPQLIIIKKRSSTGNWMVGHRSTTQPGNLRLNTTDAVVTSFVTNAIASANSSTFMIYSYASGVAADNLNDSGATYLAYCFAPVAGYSSFGSYTGNGSADGPFVYTGFRPRWIMIKPLYQYDGGGSTVNSTAWYIYDSARGTYNANGAILGANNSYAEENNATDIDFLSNGFKLRNTRAVNTSNGAIYAAFAESPFQFSRAR